MITIYIVVAGLVAVVPGYDEFNNKNVIDILVLNTTEDVRSDAGVPINKHSSRLTFVGPSPVEVSLGRESGFQEVEVKAIGQPGLGPWELKEEERIPSLNQFYSGVPFRGAQEVPIEVRRECLDGESTCQDANGAQLLSARFRLTGGWTISPIEVNKYGGVITEVDNSEHALIRDKSEYTLVGLGAGVPRFASPTENGSGPLAGGLLLSLSVRDEEVRLLRNGKEEPLKKSPDCAAFGLPQGSCVVISVSNAPGVHSYQRATCDEMPSERIDLHFDRFYDLLENPPVLRLLPMLSSLDKKSCCDICQCCKAAGGDPPGIKCMDGLIMGLPAEKQ